MTGMRLRSLLIVIPFVFSAKFTFAQSDDLAKGHYMAGEAYYQQARYSEAIREFEEAYRLSPKPALLYNLAQAYERWGKIDKAVEYFKRYIAVPHVPNRSGIAEKIKNLQARLKQTGVQIFCETQGASVFINGKEVGQTPIFEPMNIETGSHEIRVVKAGYTPFSAFVSVVPGNIVQVTVKLVPIKAAPPVILEKPADHRDESIPTVSSTSRKSGKLFWTWVAGGTASVLLLTCAITGGIALKKADSALEKEPLDKEKADLARSLALISDISLGVGIAAAVGATLLYFYEKQSPESSIAISPYLSPEMAGVGARLSF